MVSWPCESPLPPPLKTFFKSFVAIVACLYLGGAHLAVLQLVAWTGMVVVYSGENGMARGMSETFSGEKPCPLCKAINQAKRQDLPGNGTAPVPAKGMEKILKELVMCGERTMPGFRALGAFELACPDPVGASGLPGTTPPVPPPRARWLA